MPLRSASQRPPPSLSLPKLAFLVWLGCREQPTSDTYIHMKEKEEILHLLGDIHYNKECVRKTPRPISPPPIFGCCPFLP